MYESVIETYFKRSFYFKRLSLAGKQLYINLFPAKFINDFACTCHYVY